MKDGGNPLTRENPTPGGRGLRASDLTPLLGFVVPNVVIGFGYVIPRSPIAGVNELTIGFGITIVAAVVTYIAGVRRALRR
jgi:ABC-type Fe3+ transport system permease subunit